MKPALTPLNSLTSRLLLTISGGALLLLFGVAAYVCLADDSAYQDSKEQSGAFSPADVSSNDLVHLKRDRASSIEDPKDKPRVLSQADVVEFNNWMAGRGYEQELRADGTVIEKVSGYKSLDDRALRLLALNGDKIAQMQLGSRVVARLREQGDVSSEELAETFRFLDEASAAGYTSSLSLLAETHLLMATRNRYSDLKNLKVAEEPLIVAHSFLLLLERRGDPNARPFRLLLETDGGKLTFMQEKQAQIRSDKKYEALSFRRAELGLGSFVDGVPPAVTRVYQDFYARIFKK